MKERLSEKVFGENGEVSNRRVAFLMLKGLTLSFLYPLDLDRQMIESLRIRHELRELANKVEMNQFQKPLKPQNSSPSQDL